MIYTHYSAKPLEHIESFAKLPAAEAAYRRPTGLWLSVDDDWPAWCEAHNWHLDRLQLRYLVELKPTANLIILNSNNKVEEFSHLHNALNENERIYYLHWPRIRKRYSGVVFSAECFRTCMPSDTNLSWIKSWDVRSACIWDAEAIKSFKQDLDWKNRSNLVKV